MANTLYQFLVNWVINNLQPFSVVNSSSFRIFCNELDPAFLVPEAKTVKATIHQAYNFTYPKMIEQIGKEAVSVEICGLAEIVKDSLELHVHISIQISFLKRLHLL